MSTPYSFFSISGRQEVRDSIPKFACHRTRKLKEAYFTPGLRGKVRVSQEPELKSSVAYVRIPSRKRAPSQHKASTV